MATRETLADIIVRIAGEIEGDAVGEEGTEALARYARECDPDRLVGQARMTIALGDLARQHGADGAVGVANAALDHDRGSPIEGGPGKLDQRSVQNAVDVMLLRAGMALGRAAGILGLLKQSRE